MIELSLLRHFVAVAQTKSFTRAALSLNASQPVISRSIQRLEDQLGVALIVRSTRSVSLTAAGEALCHDATQIIERLAIAVDNARRVGLGEKAVLRIGICPTTESPALVRGLARFRQLCPTIDLRLSGLLSNEQAKALRSSTLDIGIMQVDEASIEGVKRRVIARYGLIVAVPAAWGYRAGSTIRLAELQDRPWLLPTREMATAWHDGLREMCRRAGFEPKIAGVADDPVTARILIGSGAGATFFHDKGWIDPGGEITLLKFSDRQTMPPSQTAIAWADGSASPQIEAFVACLEDAHGIQPPACVMPQEACVQKNGMRG